MTDPLKPSPQLLIKLGSLITHYQEFNSPDGHEVDKTAINAIEGNEDVKEWISQIKWIRWHFYQRKENNVPTTAQKET